MCHRATEAVSRPIRITKHRRRTTMLDFRIFVFSHFTNADPCGSSNVKGQGEYGKVVYDFLLVPNSNFDRRVRCLGDICEFLEPFLESLF